MEKITFIPYQDRQKFYLLGASPGKEKVWPLRISSDDCACSYSPILASLCFQYPHFSSQNPVSVLMGRLGEFLGGTVLHVLHVPAQKHKKQESLVAFAFLLLLSDFWVACCNTTGLELPAQAWWCNLLISSTGSEEYIFISAQWEWHHIRSHLQFSISNAEEMLLTSISRGVHWGSAQDIHPLGVH